MSLRPAELSDIEKLHRIRTLVNENRLSSPELISHEDYAEFISKRGKGFVFEDEEGIKGFAVCDLRDNNVWALFVHPDFEKRGIGRLLHDEMLKWYFSQEKEMIWLSTAPNTRAFAFYVAAGWKHDGNYGKSEEKFVIDKQQWLRKCLR